MVNPYIQNETKDETVKVVLEFDVDSSADDREILLDASDFLNLTLSAGIYKSWGHKISIVRGDVAL